MDSINDHPAYEQGVKGRNSSQTLVFHKFILVGVKVVHLKALSQENFEIIDLPV